MRIVVKSFLTLRKVMDGQASLEIEAEELTIRQLLEKLCDRFGENLRDMIFDRGMQGQSQDIKILINGRHFRHLPDGFDSRLKDGDEVSIFPLMAGG
ncbi:MAG: MoaD family protein [Desulfobacteraceae bacterium]|jgi:MoaD family protein|nr:MoaD family protein [Desulfobacteraceae bacterium]